jgi:hypothetical protein
MGAEQPEIGKASRTVPGPILPLLTGVAILVIVLVLFTKIYFNTESEATKLKPQEEAKLQKRLKEIDEAEQYALIADENGWFQCNHSGRTTFYLQLGEVWKYGTTTKGQFGRYSISYLARKKVSYIVEFEGTIAECLKEEQRKLFYYPFLPENLARTKKDWLPRPPFNSKMQ